MNTIEKEKFDQWAIVELFGHQRIAGRVSEQTIGGCSFVRVDVPAIESSVEGKAAIPGFTKLFGNGAIYAMSFVDEQTARFTAKQLKLQPIDTWSMSEAIKAMDPAKVQNLLAPPARERASDVEFGVETDGEIPY